MENSAPQRDQQSSNKPADTGLCFAARVGLRSAMAGATLGLCWLVWAGGVVLASESAATQPTAEPRPILTPEQRLAASTKLINDFVEHVRGSELFSSEAKLAVAAGWEQHQKDEQPADFLLAGLSILSEPLKQALTALDQEDYAKADEALKELSAHQDPYLSIHAAALRARSLVEQGRIEEAEPLLATLAAREQDLMRYSFLEAEVDFLLAYSRLANLHYDEARQALEAFEQQHGDAPDKFRLPARQMLQELAVRKPESLGEVSDLMGLASRRLTLGRADRAVQDPQQKALDLLDKLLAEAEEREKQQKEANSGKGGGPRPAGAGGRPAQISAAPGGPGTKGTLHRSPVARPGEQWGQMRPEERERIMQALREHFPSRYRQLVEQYYRQLAKEP